MRVIKESLKTYLVKSWVQCILYGQGRRSSLEMAAGIRLLFVVAGLLGLAHGTGLGLRKPGMLRMYTRARL